MGLLAKHGRLCSRRGSRRCPLFRSPFRYGGIWHRNASALNLSVDESGWAWFIPLHGGLTSVGVVRDQAAFNRAVRLHSLTPRGSQSFTSSPTTPLTGFWDASPTSSSAESSFHRDTSTNPPTCGTPPPSLSSSSLPFSPGGSWSALVGAEQRYLKALDLAPGVKRLLGSEGLMLRGEPESDTVRTASDYSYSASSYAGENFRIVGDAAGAFSYHSAMILISNPKIFAGVSLHRSILFVRCTPRHDWRPLCCSVDRGFNSRGLFRI